MADHDAIWDPTVIASDSSSYGIGICAKSIGSDMSGNYGRVSEKWRFMCEDAIHARSRALGTSGSHDILVEGGLPGAGRRCAPRCSLCSVVCGSPFRKSRRCLCTSRTFLPRTLGRG
eukprot:810842-Heterocapsa_arctica.AAC.1